MADAHFETTKACFKCGVAKPLDQFYGHPMMTDGRLGKCKDCTKADVKENRYARAEYYRQYDRARSRSRTRKPARSRRSASRGVSSRKSRAAGAPRAGFLSNGYRLIDKRDHPRSGVKGYVREHILVAESALGKHLPKGAVIHHANEQKSDNRNANLVICQDSAYHRLLHVRMRVKALGGDPNTQKICGSCGAVKPKDQFGTRNNAYDRLRSVCFQCMRLAFGISRAIKKESARGNA